MNAGPSEVVLKADRTEEHRTHREGKAAAAEGDVEPQAGGDRAVVDHKEPRLSASLDGEADPAISLRRVAITQGQAPAQAEVGVPAAVQDEITLAANGEGGLRISMAVSPRPPPNRKRPAS